MPRNTLHKHVYSEYVSGYPEDGAMKVRCKCGYTADLKKNGNGWEWIPTRAARESPQSGSAPL